MIRGSCHCGAVRYRLDTVPTQGIQCNCSICRRRGYLLSFHKPEEFTLETSRDALTVYRFNRHVVGHQFCKTCGCAPFSEGVGPNGPAVAIDHLQ